MLWVLAFVLFAIVVSLMFGEPLLDTLGAIVGFILSLAVLAFLAWVFIAGWRAIFFS